MGGKPVKPKIQAYVDQRWFDEFEVYRAAHNLNQSKGLEKLLAEFFGGPSASSLPSDDAIAISSLADSLRAELAELRLELVQRLELVESRLAVESATFLDESAAKLNGLASESADESAVVIAEATSQSANELVDESTLDLAEATTPLDEMAESAANLKCESVDGVAAIIAKLAFESAKEQTESAPLEEFVDESVTTLDESASKLATELAAAEGAIAAPKIEPLTATGLAARLDVNQSSVSRNKDKGNQSFKKWSAENDPDGISWEYRPEGTGNFKYYPATLD